MKNAMVRTSMLIALLALMTIGLNAQGLYWESEVSGEKMDGKEVMKTWYMPKMLKIETGNDGDLSLIHI